MDSQRTGIRVSNVVLSHTQNDSTDHEGMKVIEGYMNENLFRGSWLTLVSSEITPICHMHLLSSSFATQSCDQYIDYLI